MDWSASDTSRKCARPETIILLITQSKSIQLFLNPITQGEDAVAGVEQISGVLIRCRVLENTYNQACASQVTKEYGFQNAS